MESRFNVVSVETGQVDVMTSGNFKNFGLSEENVERLLSKGVMLKGDIKIIGRQVAIPEYRWRVDLVGLRKDGTLVIIEVKRDREDMEHRKEPCEMQVIRYAACFAEIRSVGDLVDQMYYAFAGASIDVSETDDRLKDETVYNELVSQIEAWLHKGATINGKQELVLVASGFDAGSLLACEWIAKTSHGRIVINCIQVSPFKNVEDKMLLVVDKVFPIPTVHDLAKRPVRASASLSGDSSRNSFMSTTEMFDEGLISAGQVVYLKGTDFSATIVDGTCVSENGKEMRWNEWAKSHKTGSFSLYQYVCVGAKNGRTLHELRVNK